MKGRDRREEVVCCRIVWLKGRKGWILIILVGMGINIVMGLIMLIGGEGLR